MLFTRYLFFALLLFNQSDYIPKDKSIFISPLKIPLSLSSNFGELRIDHFHSGVDIKTQGVTGKEVLASADGYIYRISVSPGGFGKALYVSHPSGYSTVYAHLDRFTPKIDDYVKAMQYEKMSYLVTLFPGKEQFPVKQGDPIAYSGNSGSSGGPHLHYEIRKSNSETPVNPLLFEFSCEDNIEPVIEKLAIYPLNNNTLINNKPKMKIISVSGGHGKYFIPKENEINISGLAGFGIKTSDLLNDSYNKCAVYSIELKIDSITIFKYNMDGFSFNETRYVNSHIDYETYMKENIYVERTFILPNDKLSVYKEVINRGLYNFIDEKIHHAEIIVTDIRNNKSSLSFNVKALSKKTTYISETVDENIKLMPYSRTNKFISEDIMVHIPEGALYDTLHFSYKKSEGTNQMVSALHSVHNKFTPVQKAYSLSIKPNKIPSGKESKMLIVQLGDDQKKNPLTSTWAEGYVTAEVRSFGRFYIGIDSVAPDISPIGFISGEILSGKKEMKIKITDDYSGIKSYEPTIDGKWALFEYDLKTNLIIYTFDEQKITRGTKHLLSLKVTDNKDNTNHYNCDFTW